MQHGFLAPDVLSVEHDRVILEKINSITSLQEIYIKKCRSLRAVVERAGEVLASLHQALPDSRASTWTAPPRFGADLKRAWGHDLDCAALPQAVLHGDYSFSNVFVSQKEGGQIVVLDPCPNYGSTLADWERGPVYVDIGKMLACLEGQVPVRSFFSRPRLTETYELQNRFLAGYARRGVEIDANIARAFAFACASAQFQRRFGKLGVIHRTFLYNRFRGNYPITVKGRNAT